MTDKPKAAPKGWRAGSVERRFAQTAPASYDAKARTVDACLSMGSPVKRWSGIEQLSMQPDAVNLDRMQSCGINFLDSHNSYGIDSIVGSLARCWLDRGALMGTILFADTDTGRKAEGMVARGEIAGVSIGYRVDEWQLTDKDGNEVDPDQLTIAELYDEDAERTWLATRWELLEASLVSVPADPQAGIRSLLGSTSLTPIAEAAREDQAVARLRRDANEVTLRSGDLAITYRSDAGSAAFPHRAEPVIPKDGRMIPKTAPGGTPGKDAPVAGELAAVSNPAELIKIARQVGLGLAEVEDAIARNLTADAFRTEIIEKKAPAAAAAEGAKAAPANAAAGELVKIARQAGLGLVEAEDALARNLTPDAFRAEIFEKLAARSAQGGPQGGTNGSASASVEVLTDEAEGRSEAMAEALYERMIQARREERIKYEPFAREKRLALMEPAAIDRARLLMGKYRGMGLIEIAAECTSWRGKRVITATTGIEILERAFQATTDYPAIFYNALNKALLARYDLAAPTYKEIAAERPFADFRDHPQIRAGDFPVPQPVTETGELKVGSSADLREKASVLPYGVIFTVSRQMLVNDDLGAIDQILGSAGDVVPIWENQTFFTMMLANSGAGPALNQDSFNVFDATNHKNQAAAGADPTVATIGAGRAAMRSQKSISGLFLNVPPRMILTGPLQETAADQMVTSITPTLTTSVNPFSGRLRSVSDANITDNSWYLATEPGRIPCFIFGYLNGAMGPRIRVKEPFGMQGVKISLEHDFGCGAIDYRGFYRVPAH